MMTISRPTLTEREKTQSFCLCYFSRIEEDLAQMDCALQNVMDIIQAASLIRMLPGNNLPKRKSNCLLTPDLGAQYRLSYIPFAPFMFGATDFNLGFLGEFNEGHPELYAQ